MATPIWAPSPWRADQSKPCTVARLEVTLTGKHLQVRDREIGEVYLDTYVFTPDTFSLVVKFNANGVRYIEVGKE